MAQFSLTITADNAEELQRIASVLTTDHVNANGHAKYSVHNGRCGGIRAPAGRGEVHRYCQRHQRALVASMKDCGFRKEYPILINGGNTIIDGERRWRAAKEAGRKSY